MIKFIVIPQPEMAGFNPTWPLAGIVFGSLGIILIKSLRTYPKN
jgi:hypothetical protein